MQQSCDYLAFVQTEDDVDELMLPSSGIVRHRGKINSAVHNARCVLEVQAEHASLAKFLWSFMPNGRPIVNKWKCDSAAQLLP